MTKNVKIWIGMIAFAGIAVFSTEPAFCDMHASDTASIQGDLSSMASAIDKGDANGAVAYVAPNFVDYDKQGHIDCNGRAQDLQLAKKLIASSKSIAITSTLENIKFLKDKALVLESDSGTLQVFVGDKLVTMSYRATVYSAWVKQSNGGWLESESHSVSSSMRPVSNPASSGAVQ